MSEARAAAGAPSQERVLWKLFLLLFLRGRSARGMAHSSAQRPPSSLTRILRVVLFWDAVMGLMAFLFMRQPVFALATYLHAMTFMILGMFVATSAGEVLFNREEADILLHRPVTPRALLGARVAVLVQVSLLMAVAFNLAGLFVGLAAPDGRWFFPLAHLASVALQAVFTTATVILVYQLCLRWFGRERLESLMTATQVVVAMVVVIGGQIVPQFLLRVEGTRIVRMDHWWVSLLPPAWFASIDDAVAGSGSARAWILAAAAAVATAGIAWSALVRLAGDYQVGLQTMTESSPRRTPVSRRPLLDRLLRVPPLSWWLRDSVSRTSFRLVAAYLARDRDMKLRVWPGIAPILVMPLMMLLPSMSESGVRGAMAMAFGGAFVAFLPIMVIDLLETSQQWQAADLFRLAPVAGPAALSAGTRGALMLFVALPLIALVGGIALLGGGRVSELPLLLPGIIALPVYGMAACLGGRGVPLSRAPDVSKAAHRVFHIFGAMIVSGLIGALAVWAHRSGWLHWMLLGELAVAGVLYALLREAVEEAPWHSLE